MRVCIYIYIYTIFFARSPSLKHRDLSRAVSIQKKKKKERVLSIAAMKKKRQTFDIYQKYIGKRELSLSNNLSWQAFISFVI